MHDRTTSTPRTLAVLAIPLVVPWSVQVFSGPEFFLVFAWGLVSPDPLSVTTIYEYLFVRTLGLPGWILAWPTGVGLYLLALASAAVGVATGREDPRVTAGLLVLAGATQLSVAWGFSAQPERFALPTGTAVLWAVAWGGYRSRVRGWGRGRSG